MENTILKSIGVFEVEFYINNETQMIYYDDSIYNDATCQKIEDYIEDNEESLLNESKNK